jgi:hypothetical protein
MPENVPIYFYCKNIKFKAFGTGYSGGYACYLYSGISNIDEGGNSDLVGDVGNIIIGSTVAANGPYMYSGTGNSTSATIDIPLICSAQSLNFIFSHAYCYFGKTVNLNLDQITQSNTPVQITYEAVPGEAYSAASTINLNLPSGWSWSTKTSTLNSINSAFKGTFNSPNYSLSGDYMFPQSGNSPTDKDKLQYNSMYSPQYTGWLWKTISVDGYWGIDYTSFTSNDKITLNSTNPFTKITTSAEPGITNMIKSLNLEDSGATLENITVSPFASSQTSPFANPMTLNILTAGSNFRNVQLIYPSTLGGSYSNAGMFYNSSNFSYNKTLKIFSKSTSNIYSNNYFLKIPDSAPNGINFSASYTTSASPGITFEAYVYGINSTTGNMEALTNPTVDVDGTSIDVTASYSSGDLSSYTKTLVYIWKITKTDSTSAEVSFTTLPTITAI